MTRQEILDTIAPVIMMHRAAGHTIEIAEDPRNIKVTPGSQGAFGSSFIEDISAVCRENFIAFAIGAQADPIQPFILL